MLTNSGLETDNPFTLEYVWDVLEGGLDLSNRTSLRTDRTNPVLVLSPGSLSFGRRYVFRLTATTQSGSGTAFSNHLFSRLTPKM
jgi:hypothetical protein